MVPSLVLAYLGRAGSMMDFIVNPICALIGTANDRNVITWSLGQLLAAGLASCRFVGPSPSSACG